MNKPKIEHPKVFISYAWTSELYVNKVAAFANSLMSIGIDVLFDKFEMKPGNELNDFMEKSVKDPSVTNILLILNKTYQEKADNRQGGVGKETQIISEKLYNNVNQTKIIPIVFEKGSNGEIYKPAYLGSTYYIDLADEEKYDTEFQLLIKTLCGETVYRKPELGKIPAWVTESISFEPKIAVRFSSFKNQANKEVNNQNFIIYLDDIKDKILSYKADDINSADNDEFFKQYLDKYSGLLSIRNEYLSLIKNWAYVDSPEKKIAAFLEKTENGISALHANFSELQAILLHEIFIYTIAYFVRLEKYDKVAYILGKTYYFNKYTNNLYSFEIFYCRNQANFNNAVRYRDNKQYYTGIACYWLENIVTDFCSKDDFILADLMCFNYVLFGAKSGLRLYWFPITYIYGMETFSGYSLLKPFAEKLKTKEFLKSATTLFNYDSVEQFISKYKEIEDMFSQGKLRDYRYNGAFESAPTLCQYVRSSELGQYR